MVTPTHTSILVPPMTKHWDYFTRAETNTFHGRYAAILGPFVIDPTAAASAATADIARLIYAADQEVFPIAFLQRNQEDR